MDHLTDAPAAGMSTSPSRRRVLGAGLAGAALSLVPFAARRAGAQSDDPGPGGATTTTAPPKRPTDDDIEVLALVRTLELAALELYDDAIGAGGMEPDEELVLRAVREAHRASANAISALLGRGATGKADEGLVDEQREGFSSSSVATRLGAASAIESALVATHREVIGELRATDGAALIGAIAVAEARHGTVLADLAGNTDLSSLLVDEPSAAIELRG